MLTYLWVHGVCCVCVCVRLCALHVCTCCYVYVATCMSCCCYHIAPHPGICTPQTPCTHTTHSPCIPPPPHTHTTHSPCIHPPPTTCTPHTHLIQHLMHDNEGLFQCITIRHTGFLCKHISCVKMPLLVQMLCNYLLGECTWCCRLLFLLMQNHKLVDVVAVVFAETQ